MVSRAKLTSYVRHVIYLFESRIREPARRYRYAPKVRSCGKAVRFGGPHITIVGGHGKVGRGITIGDGCTIYDYCVLVTDDYTPRCGIELGAGSSLNYGTQISGIGGVTIGKGCLLGPGIKIVGANHRFDDPDRSIREQGNEYAEVVIEDGAWLAANVVVVPGVRIGRGAVIAAGAVVTEDVPAGMIAAGVPARIIGARGDGRENAIAAGLGGHPTAARDAGA